MVLKSSFPPVPISEETLHKKLLGAIWQHGISYPTQHAIITSNDPTKCLTFHELHAQVHSVRAFLIEKGFRHGDIACIVVPNCVEWVVFKLGVIASGGAVSGTSALFTEYELEGQFADSRSSIVLTDEQQLEKVMKAAENCATVKTIICIRNSASNPAFLPARIVEWSAVLSRAPEYDIAEVDLGSIVSLPYSSGTTGLPKGVMLSHRNVGTMVEIFKEHFDREVFNVIGPENHSWHNEKFILFLPFYHVFGYLLLNTALLSGATMVVMSKFEPKPFLSAIQTFQPRILFTVPPILLFLAKDPTVDEFDCSSIKFVMVGAAPTGRDICLEFLSRHRNVKYLCQAYGMTEVTAASHLPVLQVDEHYMGIGKTVANCEQKIVDDCGNEVGMGERGELCLRSPMIMMGYLNRPEATVATIDKEGWLHTGDVAYVYEEGRTYIVDRYKELIKVKAFQVAPAELEDLLLSHPQIRDAAVIGIPDTRLGELVRAYVVRVNETLSEDEVVQFVAQKVSSYKRITGGVKFVKEIPKSPSGKILRRVMRDEAASDVRPAPEKASPLADPDSLEHPEHGEPSLLADPEPEVCSELVEPTHS